MMFWGWLLNRFAFATVDLWQMSLWAWYRREV